MSWPSPVPWIRIPRWGKLAGLTEPVLSPLFSLATGAFLAATVLLVLATVRVVRTLRILSRGESVLAVVTGSDDGGDGLRLRYNTLHGDPVTFPCPEGLRPVADGDRLAVVYLPHRPGSETVLDSRLLWLRIVVLAAAGLALAAAGSLALWWAPEPTQPLLDLERSLAVAATPTAPDAGEEAP